MSVNYGVILSELDGGSSQYVMVFDTTRSIIAIRDADIQVVVNNCDIRTNNPSISPERNTSIIGVVSTTVWQVTQPIVITTRSTNIISPTITGIGLANIPVIGPSINADIHAISTPMSGKVENTYINPTRNANICATVIISNVAFIVPANIDGSINVDILTNAAVVSGQVGHPSIVPIRNVLINTTVVSLMTTTLAPIITIVSPNADIRAIVITAIGRVIAPNRDILGGWPISVSIDVIPRVIFLDIIPGKVLLEVDNMSRNIVVISGNTVRLKAVFMDEMGNRVNPAGTVKFSIYSASRVCIAPFVLDSSHNISDGVFVMDYTTPSDTYDTIYFEASATSGEQVELDRCEIQLVWSK